jgi:KDO2-lipid IV(A) lauroyltransferase
MINYIGKIIGLLDYLFSKKRVRRMSKNLEQVFGGNSTEKELAAIIRENLGNHYKNIMELFKYHQLNEKNLERFVSFNGLNYLETELKKGRGIILGLGHFGPKQLILVALGLKGYKLNQVCYHMIEEELTFIRKYVSQKQRLKLERKIPAHFINLGRSLRPAFEALNKNQILLITGDGIGLPHHINQTYSEFKFLGKRCLFPLGMIILAKKTGASLLPTFIIRKGPHHNIIIEPPIEIDYSQEGQKNQESLKEEFKKFLRILEDYIRKWPSQWEFWEEFEEGNIIVPSPDSFS